MFGFKEFLTFTIEESHIIELLNITKRKKNSKETNEQMKKTGGKIYSLLRNNFKSMGRE